MKLLPALLWLLAAAPVLAQAIPQVHDDRLQLQLVAEAPQIVTPTGIAVDEQGRVLVIESHTHFRPEKYQGPETDRILLMDDFDPASGKARKISTFFEGTKHTMNLAIHPDGSIFVATRAEIFRLWDKDGDGRADERRQRIAHLETAGNYPHNGLSGFAFDFAGNVYFGFGENLGADYKLFGSDGKTLVGGGEGGNIYTCDIDGKNLRRVATGFWNPFHLCFDAFGRLFAVDNDPDSRPPCRLLHIVEGGDYGFRFRNGRKGTNPLTAWNGELPGTLPMVCGTGEAPSAILSYESDNLPEEYRGDLLVTSWGDHRIERYRLKPRGASFSGEMTPVVSGGENFRPVGLALAPDGSLYFSDWVDKSYQLHGKGRVWRLSAKSPPKPNRPTDPLAALASPHQPWREAAARKLDKASLENRLRETNDRREWATAVCAYYKDEPYRQQLVALMPDTLRLDWKKIALAYVDREKSDIKINDDGKVTVKFRSETDFIAGDYSLELAACQCRTHHKDIGLGIIATEIPPDISDPFVKSAWTLVFASAEPLNDQGVGVLVGGIRNGFEKQDPFPRRVATLWALSQRNANGPHRVKVIHALLDSPDDEFVVIGLVLAGTELVKECREDVYQTIVKRTTTRSVFETGLAALAMLDGQTRDAKGEISGQSLALRLLQADSTLPAVKCFALKTLPLDHPQLNEAFLVKLLNGTDQDLRLEALRTLRQRNDAGRAKLLREIAASKERASEERAEAVLGLDANHTEDRQLLISLAVGKDKALSQEALRNLRGIELTDPERKELGDKLAEISPPSGHPPVKDVAAWLRYAEGEGDARAGERLFFHGKIAACARCHEFEGRGQQIGPDLTTIGRTLTRERLVQSLVDPSREIAPQFTPFVIATTDGTVKTGTYVGEEVDGTVRYADATGQIFKIHPRDIEQRKPSPVSIMPDNLAQQLTQQELRDLLAFLLR